MSQKAFRTDPPSGTAPASAKKIAGRETSATPERCSPPVGSEERQEEPAAQGSEAPATLTTSPPTTLSAALKGFVATLHKQAERNTDIIDVFARALKELNREVKEERTRREILERRLREAEAHVDQLERTVTALARQSWVH